MRNTTQVSALSAPVLIPDSTFSFHTMSRVPPSPGHHTEEQGPCLHPQKSEAVQDHPDPSLGPPHCVVRWSLGVRQERRCPVIIQRTDMGHPAGRSGCVLRPPWVKIRTCAMPTRGKSRGVCCGPAPAHVCTSSPPPPHPVSTNTLLTL